MIITKFNGGSFKPDPKPEKKEKKKQKKISPVSEKRKKKNEIYNVRRPIFLIEHPRCEINAKGCTIKSTEVHHTYSGKDRDKYFLDESTWLSGCQGCHKWVHKHSKEARQQGLLK